jgi:sulfite exporter TauE/SafE
MTGAIYGSLFLAGLAGSLHCLGMCGPILIAFSQTFRSPRKLDFLAYHVGRLWTYSLLGFLVGWAGWELRAGAGVLVSQRTIAVVASLLIIVAGVAASGLVPGWRLDSRLTGCALHATGQNHWLTALLHDPRLGARLLLGAVMGLLPCGMVYAVLAMAATLPTPLHSAVAMLCFGLGTLPALSVLVLGTRRLPVWLRAHSLRLVAGWLVATGVFMLLRALLVTPGQGHAMF